MVVDDEWMWAAPKVGGRAENRMGLDARQIGQQIANHCRYLGEPAQIAPHRLDLLSLAAERRRVPNLDFERTSGVAREPRPCQHAGGTPDGVAPIGRWKAARRHTPGEKGT